MPFSSYSPSGALIENTANMPDALTVAVLDSDLEREGRTTAVLVYGFVYSHPASGAQIGVPPGFVTDFASIPAAVQFAFPPFGRHAKAAVLHDWLYAVGQPGTRSLADTIFKDAMEELQVDKTRRKVLYEAVHLFGKDAFERAERDWKDSWGDWKTGLRVSPSTKRKDHFTGRWLRAPAENFDRG